MLERILARAAAVTRRLERLERREVAEFRRWVENTNNLLHLSILLFVPLLIALVTRLSNFAGLSFLLFPPLAAGAYTLFADPEGPYASPSRFVVGLTAGAACGWTAQRAVSLAYGFPESNAVSPLGAALSIFLAGAVTWAFDVEEPSAFSTALLVLATDAARTTTVGGVRLSQPSTYVVGVAASSVVVAAAFVIWRREFYEQRAQYLYETVRGDDHVLVPMRGGATTAMFGARLAAAHDAGKVVLLEIVAEGDAVASGKDDVSRVDGFERPGGESEGVGAATETDAAVDRLESTAAEIRTRLGVPCEVVVASGPPVRTALDAARNANCDLIVTPYEEGDGVLSEFVRGVFDGPSDAVAFRSATGIAEWRRILVPVSRPGDTAHAMIDFASRLAGASGDVSVCTCIDREVERRPAETTLANLVETVDRPVETRVARAEVVEFVAANAGAYDLVVIGSSGDRSAASRFVSPPTFERVREVDCDVAIFDRGRP